jgi:dihydrofolate reductase
MKVRIFMAQTVNAKTARKTGEEDFLSPMNWQEFKQVAENTGAFTVGRKTYEAVREWKGKGFRDIDAERIVLSRKEEFEPGEGYIKASSPDEAVEAAKEKDLDSLLVTGGASVNTSFMKAGLVDEIILDIEPHVLGEGLNLFAEGDFEQKLELEEARELEEDIVQLRYSL